MASEDGRRFIDASGEAWYEANVAAGAEPGWARAAADRCVGAYLGEKLEHVLASERSEDILDVDACPDTCPDRVGDDGPRRHREVL